MTLYADENVPIALVVALRELGHDVLTAHDAGNANQRVGDAAVVAFATSSERAVLTLNRRDFIRLHTRDQAHAGIIACTADRDLAAQEQRIDDAIDGRKDLHGQLLRVNRPPR